MELLPFSNITADLPCVVVDARHPEAAATLSHWRGAPVPDELRADTSTEIALKAAMRQHPSSQLPFVSNNHFDVDGCLGIWSLLNPDIAENYVNILIQAALIGDFREYNPYHPAADDGLKLVCWINSEEKKRFYVPFGEKDEAENCIPKYEFFLPKIGSFLQNPEAYKKIWEEEYDRVRDDTMSLRVKGKESVIEDIHLRIVEHPDPLHYYALFGRSSQQDLVLAMFSDNRYELEYKYISWVDTHSRDLFPRLDFGPLVNNLNQLEQTDQTWWGNSIMDTGSSMRLGGKSLTKAERFAHPYERIIHPSSIPPNQMRELVIESLRKRLANISPKARWTWQEMRNINQTN